MHLEDLQQWTNFCFWQSEYSQRLWSFTRTAVLHGKKWGTVVGGVGPQPSSVSDTVREGREGPRIFSKYKTTSFTCPLKVLPFSCTARWETPLRVWWAVAPLGAGAGDESHAGHRWTQSSLGAQPDTPWEEASPSHLLQDHQILVAQLVNMKQRQLRWVCSQGLLRRKEF